jgi:uncharacterized RDD family membrane protein YckC
MNNPDYLISTPENVDLHLELAGLGNRIMAGLVDRILLGAVNLFILLIFVGGGVGVDQMALPTDTKTVIYYYLVGIGLFLLFVLNAGYFIFFEGMWRGQTPGKRIAQIRVIEANGQPVGWSSVFIRNLLRIVDEIPGVYLGLLPMIIDKNERRFGDLAAGTLVIRERLQSLSSSDIRLTAGNNVEALVDTGQISPSEYGLLVTFLKRRDSLSPENREAIATSMSARFRDKLGALDESDSAEIYLEKLYVAYNKRAEIIAAE